MRNVPDVPAAAREHLGLCCENYSSMLRARVSQHRCGPASPRSSISKPHDGVSRRLAFSIRRSTPTLAGGRSTLPPSTISPQVITNGCRSVQIQVAQISSQPFPATISALAGAHRKVWFSLMPFYPVWNSLGRLQLPGATQNGTFSAPFKTLVQAGKTLFSQVERSGSRLQVPAPETPTISKPLTIRVYRGPASLGD